eukprot:COSAG05_NODE_5962_length_1050_cov_1.317560_1_plen_112_part_10
MEHDDGSDSEGEGETYPWRTKNKYSGEEEADEGVPPSPSRGSSSEREAGGSVGGGGASSGGTLASPGATIMDGWFETKIYRRGTDGQLPTIDYKQNWGKHYCVLTSELTGSM